MLCWMCGSPADSGEHRLKKADLVRAYGKGPYSGPSAPLHFRDGKSTPLQGPNSRVVKYSHSICQACNNAATQPYDRAYDVLLGWLRSNECDVLRKRLINFEEVYGSDFQSGQLDLFKYFVKSFGCRLVDAEQGVPQDLIDLLPLRNFRTALQITFCVNEDVLLLSEPTRWRFIGNGTLTAYMSKSEPGRITGYSCDEFASWFTVCCWYAYAPESGLGSPWIANTQHVYLGSVSPLPPEERENFRVKSERPFEADA